MFSSKPGMFWVFYTCLALMVRAGTVSHGPWACSTVQVFIGYKVQGSPTMCWATQGLSQACAERSLPVALGSSAFSWNSAWCSGDPGMAWALVLVFWPQASPLVGPLQQHFWTTSQCCKDPHPFWPELLLDFPEGASGPPSPALQMTPPQRPRLWPDGEKPQLWSQTLWVRILALPVTNHTTLEKSLNLFLCFGSSAIK